MNTANRALRRSGRAKVRSLSRKVTCLVLPLMMCIVLVSFLLIVEKASSEEINQQNIEIVSDHEISSLSDRFRLVCVRG